MCNCAIGLRVRFRVALLGASPSLRSRRTRQRFLWQAGSVGSPRPYHLVLRGGCVAALVIAWPSQCRSRVSRGRVRAGRRKSTPAPSPRARRTGGTRARRGRTGPSRPPPGEPGVRRHRRHRRQPGSVRRSHRLHRPAHRPPSSLPRRPRLGGRYFGGRPWLMGRAAWARRGRGSEEGPSAEPGFRPRFAGGSVGAGPTSPSPPPPAGTREQTAYLLGRKGREVSKTFQLPRREGLPSPGHRLGPLRH